MFFPSVKCFLRFPPSFSVRAVCSLRFSRNAKKSKKRVYVYQVQIFKSFQCLFFKNFAAHVAFVFAHFVFFGLSSSLRLLLLPNSIVFFSLIFS